MAAIHDVRPHGPLKTVVATAVASMEAAKIVGREADEAAILTVQENFGAVGEFFQDFRQVGDEEVIRILNQPQAGARPIKK